MTDQNISGDKSDSSYNEDNSGVLPSATRRGALLSLAGLGLLGATSSTASAASGDHLGESWIGDPSGSRGLLIEVGTSTPKAIEGASSADNARAFTGYASSNSGFTRGFKGRVDSPDGIGVFGDGTASSGNSIGVRGRTQSFEGIGILGQATAGSGSANGIEGRTQSPSGYGVYTPDDAKIGGKLEIGGNLQVTGTKNFVQTVDTTAGPKNVHYNAVESGRARTEHTGTAEMEDGHALIELPEHFDMVTSDREELAVQVTPHAEEKVHPQVVETSTRYVSVEDFGDGPDDYRFSFTVKGVRDGFEDEEIVRDA